MISEEKKYGPSYKYKFGNATSVELKVGENGITQEWLILLNKFDQEEKNSKWKEEKTISRIKNEPKLRIGAEPTPKRNIIEDTVLPLLPRQQRKLWWDLHQGNKQCDIARIYGISADALYKRVRRLSSKISKILNHLSLNT